MQIETEMVGRYAVLHLRGRLDVAWAEHFLNGAMEVLRGGQHHIRVDASGLEYLSSAGIRVLIRVRRELAAVNGTFQVIRPSPFVDSTLRMSGLEQLLESADEPESPAVAEPAESGRMDAPSVEGMGLDVFPLVPEATIRVRMPGRWRPWTPVQDCDIRKIAFPAPVFGLGIGAPGCDTHDTRGRLGEFLAVSGCLTWLSAQGEDVPDYLVQEDRFIPEIYAIQALVAEGDFSHLIRFRPAGKGGLLAVSDLLGLALQVVGADAVAMVGIVEIEGLVGAALSRSPGLIGKDDTPGRFPEIRDWMAFCGERVHARQQALLVSFAARHPGAELAPFLTPLPSRPELFAHTHAVVLPFRPLQDGCIDLKENVRSSFETVAPLDLLHLIEDDRPLVGLGQSAFIRGACWCAPLRGGKEAGS